MGDQKQPIAASRPLDDLRDRVELGQKLFTLFRDIALALLLAILAFILVYSPSRIFGPLRDSGVTSVALLGILKFSIAESRRENISALSQTDQTRHAMVDVLDRMRANPAATPSADEIRTWVNSLTAATDQLDDAASRQTQVLARAAAPAARIEGWIPISPSVVQVRGNGEPGSSVVVGARPLRVRSGPDPNDEVVNILPPGSEADVLEKGPGIRRKVRQRSAKDA